MIYTAVNISWLDFFRSWFFKTKFRFLPFLQTFYLLSHIFFFCWFSSRVYYTRETFSFCLSFAPPNNVFYHLLLVWIGVCTIQRNVCCVQSEMNENQYELYTWKHLVLGLYGLAFFLYKRFVFFIFMCMLSIEPECANHVCVSKQVLHVWNVSKTFSLFITNSCIFPINTNNKFTNT